MVETGTDSSIDVSNGKLDVLHDFVTLVILVVLATHYSTVSTVHVDTIVTMSCIQCTSVLLP